ncbi:peptidylprolyl isomerase [Chelativorans xinjiangense]|uniref:peptidylprolyl isomerase n=1 Tax=Chelativorans xinjiangense TaxID=2681485 RepID=UPI0013599567|nr:peptidylprolyl isomerase [Chelativorans xinjiangense]
MKNREKIPLAGRSRLLTAALLAAALSAVAMAPTAPAMAAEIRYVVNDKAVTSYDIQRRVALLQLMRRNGNLNELAEQEMIDQTLRQQEIERVRVPVTEEMVNQSYAGFASSNNLSQAQLDQILAQSGVTKEHFKEFMRTQIGWGRLLQARQRSGNSLTEQDVVHRMLQQGGQKPTATEYMLQRVIFVIPSAERSQLLAKRKREAQAMRDRFQSCDTSIQFAKGLIDVTVQDMGRVLAPELPAEWKEQVQSTSPGSATPVRETERGVEFIGVCSAREVSDDHVAQMVFQSEEQSDGTVQQMSEELMTELREKARIAKR